MRNLAVIGKYHSMTCNSAWSRLAMALAISVGILSGCGPKSDRLAINGTVTLDGAPLDSGSIRFASAPGEKLSSAGALIQEGAYHVPQEKGLLPGTYTVEISSLDTKAPPILDRATGMKVAPERIPENYNINTQQTIQVTADGDNEFKFPIVTKTGK
jgi:hypothetical protein